MNSLKFPVLEDRDDAIRLIRLNDIDDAGYFTFTLRSTTISENPYEALSYVWGKDAPSYAVKINECTFWIRANLWSFFATCYDQIIGRDIWIDALCIDQNDTIDKNRQVGMMGEIYRQASHVRAWLHVPTASHPVHDREGNGMKDLLDFVGVSSQWRGSTSTLDARTLVITEFVIGALQRLVLHEYWSRLWIVQEILMAHKIVVQYGPVAILSLDLATTLAAIVDLPRFSPELQTHFSTAVASLLQLLQITGAVADQNMKRPCLYELVLLYGNKDCALTHDRVYALLSLASDGPNFPPEYDESTSVLLVRLLRKSCKQPTAKEMEQLADVLDVDLSNLLLPNHGWVEDFHFDEDHVEETIYQVDEVLPEPWRRRRMYFFAGYPQVDFLIGFRQFGRVNDRFRVGLIIAPNRVGRVLAEMRFSNNDCLFLMYERSDFLVLRPRFGFENFRFKLNTTKSCLKLELQDDPTAVHTLLTLGTDGTCPADFHFADVDDSELGLYLPPVVNTAGYPMNPDYLRLAPPTALSVVDTQLAEMHIPLYIETLRIKTWQDLQSLFQKHLFKQRLIAAKERMRQAMIGQTQFRKMAVPEY